MNDEQRQRAGEILAKPAEHWSGDEHKYIYSLIKKGHRDALKALRNEVLLGD